MADTNREKAVALWTRLNEAGGITDKQLLEHILFNVTEGAKALELMNECVEEFCPEWNEDEDDDSTGFVSNGQPTISDDLKSNFRSWETDCDNEDDANGLASILEARHPYLEAKEVREIAYNWVGYKPDDGASDDRR